MDQTLIAYLAGLFDGEGWVRINKSKSRAKVPKNAVYELYTGLNMCDPESLNLLVNNFGGRLYTTKHPNQPTWKDLHCWAITSKKAAAFLETIRPYSRVKATQIDIALEFQKHMSDFGKLYTTNGKGRCNPLPAHIVSYRESLYNKIYELKHIRKHLT